MLGTEAGSQDVKKNGWSTSFQTEHTAVQGACWVLWACSPGTAGLKKLGVPCVRLRLDLRVAARMRSSVDWFLRMVAVTTQDQASYLNKGAKQGAGSMTCPGPCSNALTQLFHSPVLRNRRGNRPLWRGLGTSLLPLSLCLCPTGTVQLSAEGPKTQNMFSMAALKLGKKSVCKESKTGGKARSAEVLVRVTSSGPQGWITRPYSVLPLAMTLVLPSVAFLTRVIVPSLERPSPGF